MAIEQYDDEPIRCPKIGDFVPFKFCRTSGAPFCWVVIRCWAVRIDIGQFLADNYSPETIAQGMQQPQGGRLGTILETADKCRDIK
jgi:hypothetical protein